MKMQDRVRSFISTLDIPLPADFNDDSELLTSGVLNSLALFELAGWIEEQSGRPVVAEAVDLTEEWNTVASIARFITAHRAGD